MPTPYHKLCDLLHIAPKTEPTESDRIKVLNQAVNWCKRMESAFDAETIALRKLRMNNLDEAHKNEKVN